MPGVHLQLSAVNLAQQFFLRPGAGWCTCSQCTPWLRLWL